MRFCPIKTRPPTQKGPADHGAPLRLHGHTSLFLCSPRPLPPLGPSAQAPDKTPTGSLPASTTRGQCWLLALLSLPLALTGSLGACPQGAHTASPWSSASPQGFWGEPRHSLPGEQSLGCLKLPLCCVDSGQDAGTCTRARWGQVGRGRHRVGPWPLNVAVQKLLGISGHY